METLTVDAVLHLAEQLSEQEQAELIRRLEVLHIPRQRPSQSLRIFHVDRFPAEMTLRREDEYGDDER